jgi:16S rRNA pseudouridine516 synthase
MRIDKFLSHLKYCTRSETKSFLSAHEIMHQGKRISSQKEEIYPEIAPLYLDGHEIFYKEDIHLMLYKPQGYVSANHDDNYPCAVDLIKEPYDRFDFSIAGRLDLDAEGLLILSTSGTLVHDIISPKKHLPKVYQVLLEQPFSKEKELLKGVHILDGKNQSFLAKAIHITKDDTHVYITIDEGKFHQVKRMFKAVGYEVIQLKRIRIGHLSLGDLKPGEYIEFSKEQLYD